MRSNHESEIRYFTFGYGLRVINRKNELLAAAKQIMEAVNSLSDLPDGDEGFKALHDKMADFDAVVFLNAVKEINAAAEIVKDIWTLQAVNRTVIRNKRHRRNARSRK